MSLPGHDENEIRYTPNVKFIGKSGYDNLFEFVFPSYKNSPKGFPKR
jgi:hypothetical protein